MDIEETIKKLNENRTEKLYMCEYDYCEEISTAIETILQDNEEKQTIINSLIKNNRGLKEMVDKEINFVNAKIEEKNSKIKELERLQKLCHKETKEQMRILLSKYWLTHTNDEVFEQFKCNYVPNTEYLKKAREIVDISELDLTKVANVDMINKDIIKGLMYGATSYEIS